MNNQKIASEMVEKVVNRVAASVASEAGLYHRFTGTISVKNAIFELKRDGKIDWKKGTWVAGK